MKTEETRWTPAEAGAEGGERWRWPVADGRKRRRMPDGGMEGGRQRGGARLVDEGKERDI